MTRFRAPIAAGITAPAATDPPRVDREAGIIRGASAMQAVEALGHDVMVDAVTLQQVAELGNAAEGGIKVRFTHPGLCGDGMGTYLGRMRDFRVEGDKVVGDIHLGQAAAASPDGDLRAYVLQLAAEDPAAFGMSVVVEAGRVWQRPDGSEVDALSDLPRPADATTAIPLLRPTVLAAVDVVDEPAANRDGIFGRGAALLALARGTNADAAEAFAALDRLRDAMGYTADQAQGLLARYLDARKPAQPAATAAQVRALAKAHPGRADRILDLAAEGAAESAIVAALEADARADVARQAEALLAKHASDATAAKARIDALTKQVAELTDQLAKAHSLAVIAGTAPADLGPGEGGGVTCTAAEFAAKTPAERADFIAQHGIAAVIG